FYFFGYVDPFLDLYIVLGGFIGWLLGAESTTQQPHENSGKARRGSWSRLVARLKVGVLFGLGVVLSFALRYWLHDALRYWLSDDLSYGLSFGLSFGLSVWLLLGLFQGVSSETIRDQHRVVPNQGIRR